MPRSLSCAAVPTRAATTDVSRQWTPHDHWEVEPREQDCPAMADRGGAFPRAVKVHTAADGVVADVEYSAGYRIDRLRSQGCPKGLHRVTSGHRRIGGHSRLAGRCPRLPTSLWPVCIGAVLSASYCEWMCLDVLEKWLRERESESSGLLELHVLDDEDGVDEAALYDWLGRELMRNYVTPGELAAIFADLDAPEVAEHLKQYKFPTVVAVRNGDFGRR